MVHGLRVVVAFSLLGVAAAASVFGWGEHFATASALGAGAGALLALGLTCCRLV